MCNRTQLRMWVCFACRWREKHQPFYGDKHRCTKCNSIMKQLDSNVRVPKKTADKEWKKLKERYTPRPHISHDESLLRHSSWSPKNKTLNVPSPMACLHHDIERNLKLLPGDFVKWQCHNGLEWRGIYLGYIDEDDVRCYMFRTTCNKTKSITGKYPKEKVLKVISRANIK